MDAFPKWQVSSSLKKERKQTNTALQKVFVRVCKFFKGMLVKYLLLLRKAVENVIFGDILILLPSEKYEQ